VNARETFGYGLSGLFFLMGAFHGFTGTVGDSLGFICLAGVAGVVALAETHG